MNVWKNSEACVTRGSSNLHTSIVDGGEKKQLLTS